MTLAILTRPEAEMGLGWLREEVEVLLAGVRNDMRNTNIHAYFRMCEAPVLYPLGSGIMTLT